MPLVVETEKLGVKVGPSAEDSGVNGAGEAVRHKLTKTLSAPPQMAHTVAVRPMTKYNRTLSRAQSIRDQVTSGAANFFGITDSPSDTQQRWANRRIRHCSRLYGDVKSPQPSDMDVTDYGQQPMVQDPLARGRRFQMGSLTSGINGVGRSMSMDSRGSRVLGRGAVALARRDSVAKMAWDGLSTLVKRPTNRPRRNQSRVTRQQSRSFAPASICGDDSVFEADNMVVDTDVDSVNGQQSTIGGYVHEISMEPIKEDNSGEKTDEADVVSNLSHMPARSRAPLKRQRHISRETGTIAAEESLTDDVFYDISYPEAQEAPQLLLSVSAVQPKMQQLRAAPVREPRSIPTSADSNVPRKRSAGVDVINRDIIDGGEPKPSYRHGRRQLKVPTGSAAKVADSSFLGAIWSRAVSKAFSNSDRRRYGGGVVGRFFGRTLRRHSELSPHVRKQLDSFDDHRPYFTYWVTTVQILVTIVALATYGFGPIGFTRTQKTAMVRQTNMVLEQMAYYEQENFWIGPRFADLVHMGAKYSPCMRKDKLIYDNIEVENAVENNTACCIMNDKSSCVQTTKDSCSSYAKWNKWGISNTTNGPNGRTAGSVCGQDPRTCKTPASTVPSVWPDDLTQWPICTDSEPATLDHLTCEINGRPCCYGIQGACKIATREYCDFVKGYFHEEAFLCSQVSCLNDVCGMIPFFNDNQPDQFYRLITAIFIHAGLIHCICTVVIQFFLMRDLEKLIGWSRLSIIYLMSGIGGNLASAIFVPYQAEVGPAGCQFGLIAALVVDAIYSWNLIMRPWKAVIQLSVVLLFLFAIGLLPWIDNWAHFFGFVFGLLLSLAFFPYIQFGKGDKRRRIIIVCCSLAVSVGLFAVLVVLFYVSPVYNCEGCTYFNCIPFTEHFCDNHGVILKVQVH